MKKFKNGVCILVYFYSVLGGNKIKELIEEYERIFDNLEPLETNLEHFRQYNLENRKFRNFYISRMIKLENQTSDSESKVSSVA